MARRRRRGACLGREPLQDRQRERRGLAGAGLGAGHEVAPREDERDRLLLHRSRFLVAEICNRREQRRNQA
jgi:hypothetical protein